MKPDKLEAQARGIICEALGIPTLDGVGDTEDLMLHGMDSLNCMSLVVLLEDCFEVEISEDKLGLRYVRNIRDICKLVKGAMSDG